VNSKKKLLSKLPFDLVETNISVRWEQGVEHHPKSEEIMDAMCYIDALNKYALDIDRGGDGDNGETIMFLLDVYFEALDKANE